MLSFSKTYIYLPYSRDLSIAIYVSNRKARFSFSISKKFFISSALLYNDTGTELHLRRLTGANDLLTKMLSADEFTLLLITSLTNIAV